MQSEITRLIAQQFFPAGLSPDTRSRFAAHSTDNVEAYELYLQARDILRRPLQNRLTDEAAALFQAAIDLDPDFAWAKAGLCSTYTLEYQREGSFDDAQRACEALDGYAEDLFEVQAALGDYLVEAGETDRAVEKLNRAIELNPNSADAKIALARALASRYNRSQSDLDRLRAQVAYREAIELEPSYWFGHHAYARYLIGQSRLEEAQAQLEAGLALEPDNTSMLNNLANIYFRLGDNDNAAPLWRRVLDVDPGNRFANSSLGVMYHYENDYRQAIVYYERALEYTATDHRLWGRLGESYRLLPDAQADANNAFTQAADIAEDVRRFNPNDWEVSGFLALYYAYLAQFDKANAALARMFALNTGTEPMTHYWAALVAYEQQDVERAFSELDQSLAAGFHKQKRFIADEPALQPMRNAHPERYQALLDRY